jgi:DNA-binding response OmpR family regulator
MDKSPSEPKKIINADDDPMIRDIVKAILESAGFEVISLSDGLEVFTYLDSQEDQSRISAFVLDLNMPGMNGLDVLTRLKLHAATQNIPVVLLTCQSTSDDILQGYNCGADYYITKPFSPKQLLDCVHTLVSSGSFSY